MVKFQILSWSDRSN